MRGRGGRPRNNEEMAGNSTQEKKLDTCNFGVASTDAELAAAGAWRVRRSKPDGSMLVMRHVFTALPGRVVYLHHRCSAAAVPPTLGNMNPYGSEGPKISASADARRNAATTPPSLGNMNPYGVEGPPARTSGSGDSVVEHL